MTGTGSTNDISTQTFTKKKKKGLPIMRNKKASKLAYETRSAISLSHTEIPRNFLFNKKAAILLAAFGLHLYLLTGCGESTPLLTAADYILDTQSGQTSMGTAPGDTSETFLEAYGTYRFFTSIDGGDFQVLDPEEIPFDSSVTTLLPTFFIDGQPVDPDLFCKENEIDKSELLTYLRSADFLGSHTVEYCYLTFTWNEGVIADISTSYMNYNEDGAN